MAQFSTYLANKVLDHVLRNTSYTSPASVYLALYTSNPDVDNSGDEVVGGSYARQSLSFAAASGGENSTSAGESFTMPSAVVTHIAILDASTSGNLLIFDELTNPISVNNGDEITIDSGELDVLLNES
jgi:hypothetical protein